jgi:hypothetical protein
VRVRVPQGLRTSDKTPGVIDVLQNGGNAGGNIVDGTSELLAIWSALDEPARRDLMNVARSWVAGNRV